MKENQTSMNLIGAATNTIVIGSECGHGLHREIETKRCTKCGRILPITEFNKKKHSKDGLQYHCKECQSRLMKEYHKQRRADAVIAKSIKESIKESSTKEQKLSKVYSNADLAQFTPRQLMEELKARGFKWDYMLEPQRKIYFEKI